MAITATISVPLSSINSRSSISATFKYPNSRLLVALSSSMKTETPVKTTFLHQKESGFLHFSETTSFWSVHVSISLIQITTALSFFLTIWFSMLWIIIETLLSQRLVQRKLCNYVIVILVLMELSFFCLLSMLLLIIQWGFSTLRWFIHSFILLGLYNRL